MTQEVKWERRFPVELGKEVSCFVALEHGLMIKLRWKFSQDYRKLERNICAHILHYGEVIGKYSMLNHSLDFQQGFADIQRFRAEHGIDIPVNATIVRIDDTDQSQEQDVGQQEITVLKYPAEIKVQLLVDRT